MSQVLTAYIIPPNKIANSQQIAPAENFKLPFNTQREQDPLQFLTLSTSQGADIAIIVQHALTLPKEAEPNINSLGSANSTTVFRNWIIQGVGPSQDISIGICISAGALSCGNFRRHQYINFLLRQQHQQSSCFPHQYFRYHQHHQLWQVVLVTLQKNRQICLKLQMSNMHNSQRRVWNLWSKGTLGFKCN